MFTTNKATYVNSLIDYILDVKPYHCKLTEIIEEYQFYDNINVKITDQFKSNIHLNSNWDLSYVADGSRSRFVIPSYNLPRYSLQSNRHFYNTVSTFQVQDTLAVNYSITLKSPFEISKNGDLLSSLDYDYQPGQLTFNVSLMVGDEISIIEFDNVDYLAARYNINDAYQLRASRGIESVILNSQEHLIEGIDYFLSKGMFSFDVKNDFSYLDKDGNALSDTRVDKAWNIVGNEINQKNASLITQVDYNNSVNFEIIEAGNPICSVNLMPNRFDIEAWSVEHISDSICQTFSVDVAATQWNINHNLNTLDLAWQIYIDDGGVTLTAILDDINIIDANNIQVNLSLPYSGKITLFKIPADLNFVVDDASTEWIITHDRNTKDIIVYTYVEIDNQLNLIIPLSVEFISDNSIKIKFSTPQIGKVIIIPVEQHFPISVPLSTWMIPLDDTATEYPIFQCFHKSGGIFKEIIPERFERNGTHIEVHFSQPFTGFVNFQQRSFAWFKVESKKHGLLGYATSGKRYYGRGIDFIAANTSTIGAKAYISLLADGIVAHPNAPEETWSLIKINPISYGSLIATYAGLAQVDVISNFWPEDDALVSAVEKISDHINYPEYEYLTWQWTLNIISINSINAVVQISNDHEAHVALATIAIEGTSVFDVYASDGTTLRFRIYVHVNERGLAVDDKHTFGFGYEGDIYSICGYENAQYEELSTRGTSFELERNIAPLKALPLGSAYSKAIDETWSFIFDEDGQFFSVQGSVSGGQEIAFLGKEYDNGFIRLRLIRSSEVFNVLRLNDEGYLYSYLSDAVSAGELKNGDTFYFKTLKHKPSYLVHGSVSGYATPAIIGQYYWNGKIGFNLARPIYYLSQDNHIIGKLETGTIITNGLKFIFNEKPRFDASDEQFLIKFHHEASNIKKFKIEVASQDYLICDYDINTVKVYKKTLTGYIELLSSEYIADNGGIIYLAHTNVGDEFAVENCELIKLGQPRIQFLVYSSLRGQLPAIYLDEPYLDKEYAENGIERASIINITITEENSINLIDLVDFEVKLMVRSHIYKPYHDQEIMLIPDHDKNVGKLKVNTYQEDLINLNLDKPLPELGSATSLVPLYVLAADAYSNYSLGYDGHLTTFQNAPYSGTAPDGFIYEQINYDADGDNIIDSSPYNATFQLEPYSSVGFDTDGTYGLTTINPDTGQPYQIDGVDFDSSQMNRPQKQRPTIPDRGFKHDVWLKNAKDVKVGTITWQYDSVSDIYRQVIDMTSAFTEAYLKLNTSLNLKVNQADEYNDLVKVLCHEKLEVLMNYDLNTDVNVTVFDSTFFDVAIDLWKGYNNGPEYEAINAFIHDKMQDISATSNLNNDSWTLSETHISDNGFSVDISFTGDLGYDMFPYDISGYEENPDGIEVYERFYPGHISKSYLDNIFVITSELINLSSAQVNLFDIKVFTAQTDGQLIYKCDHDPLLVKVTVNGVELTLNVDFISSIDTNDGLLIIELMPSVTILANDQIVIHTHLQLVPGVDYSILEYTDQISQSVVYVNSWHTQLRTSSPNKTFVYSLLDPRMIDVLVS